MDKVAIASEVFQLADKYADPARRARLKMLTLLIDQIRLESLRILENEGSLQQVDPDNSFVKHYLAIERRDLLNDPN